MATSRALQVSGPSFCRRAFSRATGEWQEVDSRGGRLQPEEMGRTKAAASCCPRGTSGRTSAHFSEVLVHSGPTAHAVTRAMSPWIYPPFSWLPVPLPHSCFLESPSKSTTCSKVLVLGCAFRTLHTKARDYAGVMGSQGAQPGPFGSGSEEPLVPPWLPLAMLGP